MAKKSNPISLRMTDDQIRRLRWLEETMGLGRSSVVGQAIDLLYRDQMRAQKKIREPTEKKS